MNRVKRIVCSSLVFMIALFVIFQAPVNAESNQIDDQKIKETIEETTDYILNKGVNSEWEAIGIAQSGREVPASYIETLKQNIQSQIVKGLENGRIKITDIERLALATIAVGLDPLNIEKLNLIELIYDSPERTGGYDTMTFQGNNGLTFALIALDSLGFEVPEAAKWDRGQIINELLNNQNDDGSWPLNNAYAVPDIDITAMVLTGLSHYKSQPEVATAINHALSWLSSKQLDSGGFDGGSFVGGITSEATSQVIIGLTANGIDPAGKQFTKNGISLIDHLLEFKNDDGGFKHTMDYADSDLMATEQALLAFVAYDLFLNGKGSVYQFEIESNEQLPEEEEKEEGEVPEEENDTPNTDEDQETPEEDEGIKDTINVELSDQAIEIKPNSLVTINQTEATIQLPANLPSGTTLKVKQAHIETPGLRKAGALYQFDFNYPSGKENFKGDFYLTLAVDSTIDINKAAIYYYNETTKEWEYIGGKASEGQITALVHHFSTYGVFIEEGNESDQEVVPAENDNQSSVPENEEPEDDEGQNIDDEGTVQEEQQVKATTEAGEMLPETATDLYNFILAGVILIVLGGALFIYRTKRHV